MVESDMAYRRRMQQDGGLQPAPPARPPPQTADAMGSSFDGTRQSVNRARAADRYQRQAGTGPAVGEASAPEPESLGDAAAAEVGASELARAESAPTSGASSSLDPKLAAIFDGYAEPPELEDV